MVIDCDPLSMGVDRVLDHLFESVFRTFDSRHEDSQIQSAKIDKQLTTCSKNDEADHISRQDLAELLAYHACRT